MNCEIHYRSVFVKQTGFMTQWKHRYIFAVQTFNELHEQNSFTVC